MAKCDRRTETVAMHILLSNSSSNDKKKAASVNTVLLFDVFLVYKAMIGNKHHRRKPCCDTYALLF